ncbi:rhodanese-like domain-containing protein [Candidatus Marinimicrobia bacterium]|nr:rhodanese-like domain-containing protein [Candidatus Neomarinimicrobiota bacterium]
MKQLSRTQPELSSEVAKSYLKDDNYRFLDVRTESEFLSGHIENSIHIPLQELPTRLDEIEQLKQKDIIVYCRSGARSGKATNILIKNNFKVQNLSGGILDWEGKLVK